MSEERRRRIEELYHLALDLDPEARESVLREACGADHELLLEVLTLLEHFDEVNSTFLKPPAGLAEALEDLDPREIGPFHILQRLGEGGFGLVYVAEQTEPVRRRVALKVLKEGMDTRAVLARFEAERQALALMDHPNIARVLDGGATENGRPYFVMELVKGEPITRYCDRHRLGVRARIELFIPVCQAVLHAHQKGVIHRDLKPSNILVAVVDGKAVPKVIDFGIAKATSTPLTDKTVHTLHGELMGTPAYMSPEQAERTGLDVDTTTDVYSLGVLLYELVTGRLPFTQQELLVDGIGGVARRIRELEAAAPSARAATIDSDSARIAEQRATDPASLARQLRRDLDWIILRALEKDRTRRYQTANLLALELQRYLDDEPVEAGPPDARYRLQKFARRNRVALGVIAAVLFGVVGAAGGLGVALLETSRQKQQVERALESAESSRQESEAVTDFLAGMLSAASPEAYGRDATVREVLDRSSVEIARSFADRPLLLARLRTTVGVTYRELGDYERAAEHLSRGYETRRDLLGPEAPPTLVALRELGELHHHLGQYASAESTFLAVHDIRVRSLGPAHPLSLQSANDLAAIYVREERAAEAITIAENALRRGEKTLGENDPLRIDLLGNLGSAYETEERNEDAERVLLEVLARERKLFGEGHPRVATSCQILGGLYRKLGRFEEAEPLYLESCSISEDAFGNDHLTSLRFRGNLALLYSDMQRYPEALALNEAVLEAKGRVLGDDHPSTLATLLNLCLLHLRTEDFGTAERLSRMCLERTRRAFGEDHSYPRIAAGSLGMAVLGRGRPTEAEAILRETLEGWLRIFPPDHWRVGMAREQLGEALTVLGRYEEAEELLLAGHQILEQSFGLDHDRVRESADRLARLYESWNRPEDAGHWRTSSGKRLE